MNKLINNKKIYAVIICYNAAPVLAETYKKIDKELFDKIYFFDDNSPDGSAEIAKQFDWIVVKSEKNFINQIKKIKLIDNHSINGILV